MSEKGRPFPDPERLALVVSKIHSAVMICDAVGTIEWINESFSRLTGYSPLEAIGQMVHDILHDPLTDATTTQGIMEEVRSQRPFSLDTQAYHKSGRRVWVHMSVTPTYDDDGGVVSWVIVGDDISHRKQAERRLREAMRAAERANRAKTRFLARITNQFRGPLDQILSVAALLGSHNGGSLPEGTVDRLRSSGLAMSRMVNDILELSLIEAGKITVDLRDCGLRKVIESVCTEARLDAQAKGLDFRLRWLSDIPQQFLTDPERLSQILRNLLENAVKFTDVGHILVEVSVDFPPGPFAVLQIQVSDTGLGINKPGQTFFEPFTAVERAGPRGGTGLGLAISRGLSRLLGGDITVHSTGARGSRFIVTTKGAAH